MLERLVLRDAGTGEDETVAADALFVLIGASPLTDWLPPDLTRDSHGFLLTGDDVRRRVAARPPAVRARDEHARASSRPGDVRRGSVKRVAAAVGEGAAAVQLVHHALAEQRQPAGTGPRTG